MRPDWFVDPARSGRVDVTHPFVISFRVHSCRGVRARRPRRVDVSIAIPRRWLAEWILSSGPEATV